MPNAQNRETLAKIKEELDGISAVWIVDYRGLTVKETQQLRRDVREAGAHMVVYKNTLMKLALKEMELPEMDDILAGPNAFVFAETDAAAAAKAIKDFAKGNDKLVIMGGLMDGKAYSAEEVEAIASLPSREQLLGQIAGAIAGVARGLAVTINGVPSGLARAISQVAEQKPAA
ncbi:50S ribosomal protein L10 [Curtanaerobium respiraculi]|uniref:50S ribosomal protein L10 n=1 Tax=Curtanaerobium respiraculi TaxID=2949669 RepID=UPI0024B338FB|nr:50S ribosomal protein L10 [Curtanaerobium respiraculi]